MRYNNKKTNKKREKKSDRQKYIDLREDVSKMFELLKKNELQCELKDLKSGIFREDKQYTEPLDECKSQSPSRNSNSSVSNIIPSNTESESNDVVSIRNLYNQNSSVTQDNPEVIEQPYWRSKLKERKIEEGVFCDEPVIKCGNDFKCIDNRCRKIEEVQDNKNKEGKPCFTFIGRNSCEDEKLNCVTKKEGSDIGICQKKSNKGGKRTSKNKKGGNTSLKLNLPQGPNMDCGSPFHPRWGSANSMSKLNSLPNMNGYTFHQEGNLGFIKGGNKKTSKNKKGGNYGYHTANYLLSGNKLEHALNIALERYNNGVTNEAEINKLLDEYLKNLNITVKVLKDEAEKLKCPKRNESPERNENSMCKILNNYIDYKVKLTKLQAKLNRMNHNLPEVKDRLIQLEKNKKELEKKIEFVRYKEALEKTRKNQQKYEEENSLDEEEEETEKIRQKYIKQFKEEEEDKQTEKNRQKDIKQFEEKEEDKQTNLENIAQGGNKKRTYKNKKNI